MERYELSLTPPAERDLARLPERIAAAVVEFMTGALVENPQRVGKTLRLELAGMWVARRGAYRVVYFVDEEARAVVVTRIDHRADIYRIR